jgi:hypothetical protein
MIRIESGSNACPCKYGWIGMAHPTQAQRGVRRLVPRLAGKWAI